MANSQAWLGALMSGPQKYRMLALDVDGTIARKDYSVPGRIKTAINEAVANGTVVSLVTGRMRRSALRYAEESGTNGPTVSYQGAVTTAPDGVTDTHIENLDPDTSLAAISQMRQASAHINAYFQDEIWVETESEWARQYADRMKTDLRVASSLDDIALQGPTVVMAVDEPDRIAHLVANLRPALGPTAAVTHSLPRFCEVASVRATKAHALARICSEYGIAADEVVAIGDGEGDISMIEWAGLGVASGEARSAVIESTDLYIKGPDQSGVADLVQDLLKQGKLGR